jgi:hypothetical protein
VGHMVCWVGGKQALPRLTPLGSCCCCRCCCRCAPCAYSAQHTLLALVWLAGLARCCWGLKHLLGYLMQLHTLCCLSAVVQQLRGLPCVRVFVGML